MRTTSVIEFFVRSELQSFIRGYDSLNKGDQLEGNVLEVKSDGRALIDFGDFRALANIDFPIKAGDKLPLLVADKGAQLKLTMQQTMPELSPEARSIVSRIEILPENAPAKTQANIQQLMDADAQKLPQLVKDLLSRLGQFLEALEIKPGGDRAKLVQQLFSQIRKSGLFFEKDLQTALENILGEKGRLPPSGEAARQPNIQNIMNSDLKPNLLLLKEYFQRPDVLKQTSDLQALDTLRRTVDNLLDNISNQQRGAVDKAASQSLFQEPVQVFHFSLPLPENQPNARLKVYYNQKDKGKGKGGEKKGFKLSLLLSMERLGDIRTDFFLVKNNLNVTFFVKDFPVRHTIETRLKELHNALEKSFDALVLQVIVSQKKVVEFETEDLQPEIAATRMIDVKI